MMATLFKSKSNSGVRWVLNWRVNNLPYHSSAPSRKDAMDYAEAMGFAVKEIESEVDDGTEEIRDNENEVGGALV